MLLLERRRALLGQPLLLPQPDAVLLRPRALELDELLLTLRGETRDGPLRLVRLTLDLPSLLRLLDLFRVLGLPHPLGLPSLCGLLLAQPLVLLTRRLLFLRAPLYGLSMLLRGLGVPPLLIRLPPLVGLGALLLALRLRLPLLLMLLLDCLLAAFLFLLLCLRVVLLLLLLVLLLALLFVFLLALLVIRASKYGGPDDGERTDDKDCALETLQTHASPL
jgi:hypothetical protein